MTDTVDNGVAPAAGGTEFNFREYVSPEYKEKFPEFKNMDAVMKGYEGLVSKLGASPIVAPKEGAPEAEVKDYYDRLAKAVGRPDKPDAYSVTMPEGLPEGFVNDKLLNSLRQEAFNAGIGAKQFDALASAYLKGQHNDYNDYVKSAAEERGRSEEALKQSWGKDYDRNLQVAQSFLARHIPDADQETLTKYGNDAKFIKLLHQVASKVGEDRITPPASPGNTGSGDLNAELTRLMTSEAYDNIRHADHTAIKSKVREITQQMVKMKG